MRSMRLVRCGSVLLTSALLACVDSETTAPETTVTPAAVASVEITAPAVVLEAGRTVQLAVSLKDSAGTTLTGRQINWSTSASTVATVDDGGVVRGRSAGDARISASAGGRTASIDVAVRDTAALPVMLSGMMRRYSAALPAGRTYRVSGEFTLIADSALTMAGDIVLEPGASLALSANGELNIAGTITSENTGGAAAGGAAGQFGGPGEEVVLQGQAVRNLPGETVVSARVDVNGPVYIAGGGSVRIEGNITPYPAENGTAASRRGKDGHSIYIGTTEARAKAQQKFGAASPAFREIIFGSVLLRGGAGGKGYSLKHRRDGQVVSNRWEGTAGDGGNGGHVFIAGDSVIFRRDSYVDAGAGGDGGSLLAASDSLYLLDGSGSGGEGESLLAATGSGGKGGTLSIAARYAYRAEDARDAPSPGTGGAAGSAEVKGGNAKDGALTPAGGNLTVQIGMKGAPGDLTAPAGIAGAAGSGIATVKFIHAANGGKAAQARSGGPGGRITIISRATDSSGALSNVSFTNTANGGLGFNGCAVAPRTFGTDGGPGGSRTFDIAGAFDIVETNRNFSGANGGDGMNSPGNGGSQGNEQPTNRAIGARGIDGKLCPTLIGLGPSSAGFEHTFGVTTCPQQFATVTVRNNATTAVSLRVSSLDNAVSASTTMVTLQPGQSLPVALSFNCTKTVSFASAVRFEATAAGASETIDIPVAATLKARALKLTAPLGSFAAGTIIELSRIGNARISGHHEENCPLSHLHANTLAGITIDGIGPFVDPNPTACGYGEVVEVVR